MPADSQGSIFLPVAFWFCDIFVIWEELRCFGVRVHPAVQTHSSVCASSQFHLVFYWSRFIAPPCNLSSCAPTSSKQSVCVMLQNGVWRQVRQTDSCLNKTLNSIKRFDSYSFSRPLFFFQRRRCVVLGWCLFLYRSLETVQLEQCVFKRYLGFFFSCSLHLTDDFQIDF